MCKALLWSILFIFPYVLHAQHSPHDIFIIDSIVIKGNTHTHLHIILDELPVHVGDTIEQRNSFDVLEYVHHRLMRMNLFTSEHTTINAITGTDNHITLNIVLEEKIRLYVVPELDIYDRNFNVWWVQHDHDLRRVLVGVNLRMNNVFGEGHTLVLKAFAGAANTYTGIYSIPYLNRKHTLSLRASAEYSNQRIVNTSTEDNKQVYLYSTRYQNEWSRFNVFVTHRITYHTTQTFGIEQYADRASQNVLDSNPDYLTHNRTYIAYTKASYQIAYDSRNNIDYAIKGKLASLGGGYAYSNTAQILSYPFAQCALAVYTPVKGKFYTSITARANANFNNNLPYPLQRALGYKEDYVSGYEYYVQDGSAYYVNTISLKYMLVNRMVPAFDATRWAYNANLPLMIIPKIYFENGYAWQPVKTSSSNNLSNTWLPGWGAGVDFVVLYDIQFRVEYSFNKLGQQGLFLHFKSAF